MLRYLYIFGLVCYLMTVPNISLFHSRVVCLKKKEEEEEEEEEKEEKRGPPT